MSSNRKSYSVLVGNVGQTYVGNSLELAEGVFLEYKQQSETGCGRASGEGVILFCDGEPMKEHAATFEHI